MKIFLILLLLVGCGNTSHEIDGSSIPKKIEVIHKIDIDDFISRFENECIEEFDTQIEIDICIQEKIDELLEFFNGD